MAYVSFDVMSEGKAAKKRDEPSNANPYPAGSQNSADWLEGYTFDEAEMNVDRDDGSV
ncbi:hypothetical protein [Methylobacterium iners]|jgi:hypothetical protein|uniref:Uncharacterized protein n=1 Tax=Methylobacterium iners TaxID=418707 RepID=A0ABQ4S2V5_9HYPH|nr:hypothetical protein [Methylobacterium iners]GJD97361.1 hypothetical protein OCOJLMKI_4591 [Methylobacterium iners]